ncbi:mobilization protein, partial [Staphylococcus epidermidis]|uniref:mobilization protein n=1 Tax=Staphylococcus epidermidis TaxID=1282 RepID=UPI0011A080D1
LQTNQAQLPQENNHYKKIIHQPINHNQTPLKQYDQLIQPLTKPITPIFFILPLLIIPFLPLTPLPHSLPLQHFYQSFNYLIKTPHSPSPYFILIFYLLPYLLFPPLIYLILNPYHPL